MPTGILGTGSYLPDQVITNNQIANRSGVSSEWIEERTNIKTRRYAAETQATSDLALNAAKNALARSGVAVDQLGFIIVATSTPDSPQPPTAALVQDGLGAYRAACFDINSVCSGFVYGIALAHSLHSLNPHTYTLVVAADVYSRILDLNDRSTAVLLGDGAGAAVIGSVPPSYGILENSLHTRGDFRNLISVKAGGSRVPSSYQTISSGDHYFTMQGSRVAKFVLDEVPSAVTHILNKADLQLDEVDHFVPHQPNGKLLKNLFEKIGFDRTVVHRTVEKYGNIGSASLPVTLDEASRENFLTKGDIVLLCAFGGGMSIGSCVLRWWE